MVDRDLPATRWAIEQAVLHSDLPAPARLIMLVLLVKVDNGTAVVPAEYTPSLSTLAAATGLSRAAVAAHLKTLERLAWVSRTPPPRHSRTERTLYKLHVGSSAVVQDVDYSSSPGDGLVQDVDHSSSPGAGPVVVQELDSSSPGRGHAPSSTSPTEKYPSDKPKRRTRTARTDEPRADVEQVCQHLADWIVRNGSKRPTITDEWRTEARRLIDLDKRTVDQIIRAIDWCQNHTFWRANIMSMPTLRKQYDRLRLAAADERQPSNVVAIRGTNGNRPQSTTDQRVGQAMALAAKYAEEDQ